MNTSRRAGAAALVLSILAASACAYAGGFGPAQGSPSGGGTVNSAALDSAFGSTRGAILYRGASGWTKIDPGTSGYVLTSAGAGADPSYQAVGGGDLSALDAAISWTTGLGAITHVAGPTDQQLRIRSGTGQSVELANSAGYGFSADATTTGISGADVDISATNNVTISGGTLTLSTGVRVITDSGDPEGAIDAPVGSLYLRTDGGAGTTLYVKESGGAGNTGWVAK